MSWCRISGRELFKKNTPFYWIDTIYEKVRVEGKVQSVAVMVAYGVDSEVLAVEPMWEESEDSWKDFIKGLKRRGVK